MDFKLFLTISDKLFLTLFFPFLFTYIVEHLNMSYGLSWINWSNISSSSLRSFGDIIGLGCRKVSSSNLLVFKTKLSLILNVTKTLH